MPDFYHSTSLLFFQSWGVCQNDSIVQDTGDYLLRLTQPNESNIECKTIPVLLNSTLLVVHTLVNSSEGMLLPELVPQCKESTTLAL